MHTFDLDCIGTHLHIRIDVSSSDTLDEDFSHIRERLIAFENRFSRFIPGNWLHDLNLHRRGILDTDGKNMITFALDLAKKTDGYFDPTVGKRLRDLGYGNPATRVQAVSGDQNS